MIRILVVDDNPTVRQVLRLCLGLESDLAVVGEAGCGSEALALAQRLLPDVVIMDVAMPGMDGITTSERLRELVPETGVVILSVYDDAEVQRRARQAGVTVYVPKQGTIEPLLAGIRQVAQRFDDTFSPPKDRIEDQPSG